MSSSLFFYFFSWSSSTSFSSAPSSIQCSDSVWLKSLSNSSLPELLWTQSSSSSSSPQSRFPKQFCPCMAQKGSSSSIFLRLMRQVILVPLFSRNYMFRTAMFSGASSELDSSEDSSSSSLLLLSLSPYCESLPASALSRLGCSRSSSSSSSRYFFLMGLVLVRLVLLPVWSSCFPIYNDQRHLVKIKSMHAHSNPSPCSPLVQSFPLVHQFQSFPLQSIRSIHEPHHFNQSLPSSPPLHQTILLRLKSSAILFLLILEMFSSRQIMRRMLLNLIWVSSMRLLRYFFWMLWQTLFNTPNSSFFSWKSLQLRQVVKSSSTYPPITIRISFRASSFSMQLSQEMSFGWSRVILQLIASATCSFCLNYRSNLACWLKCSWSSSSTNVRVSPQMLSSPQLPLLPKSDSLPALLSLTFPFSIICQITQTQDQS